jgi:hypothetical protein
MEMNKIILMLMLNIASSAMASNCNEDIIRNVSPDGRFLMMLSGASYDVDVADYVITQKWNAADNVLICSIAGNAAEISNKDEESQKISARRNN